MCAHDPMRTFAGVCIPYDPSRRFGALNFSFEHRYPVAQLDGFEFRVHSGGETGKAREHRTFVSDCRSVPDGMRAIE